MGLLILGMPHDCMLAQWMVNESPSFLSRLNIFNILLIKLWTVKVLGSACILQPGSTNNGRIMVGSSELVCFFEIYTPNGYRILGKKWWWNNSFVGVLQFQTHRNKKYPKWLWPSGNSIGQSFALPATVLRKHNMRKGWYMTKHGIFRTQRVLLNLDTSHQVRRDKEDIHTHLIGVLYSPYTPLHLPSMICKQLDNGKVVTPPPGMFVGIFSNTLTIDMLAEDPSCTRYPSIWLIMRHHFVA